jgi:hypothetical protein
MIPQAGILNRIKEGGCDDDSVRQRSTGRSERQGMIDLPSYHSVDQTVEKL